jgi:predicted regulator of Ras-like GTPase activity (Roadblock/LC7/MglB family)
MPQWTLFEQDFRAIDQVLNHLLDKSGALSVHLVDRSGQLITTAGHPGGYDAASFASLVAADYTANAQLSRLLGEQHVDAVVNEGKGRSIHSCLVADRVIMCTVFDRHTTLGLVRYRAQRAVSQLDQVFVSLFEKVGAERPVEAQASSGFAEAAGREVDALFGD